MSGIKVWMIAKLCHGGGGRRIYIYIYVYVGEKKVCVIAKLNVSESR